jgi:hypothetical protein
MPAIGFQLFQIRKLCKGDYRNWIRIQYGRITNLLKYIFTSSQPLSISIGLRNRFQFREEQIFKPSEYQRLNQRVNRQNIRAELQKSKG